MNGQWLRKIVGFGDATKAETSHTSVYVSGSSVATVRILPGVNGEAVRCVARADPIESLGNFSSVLAQQLVSVGIQNREVGINLVLAPELYSTTLVDKPDVPDKELSDAVKWLIQEQVDFPVDQASIDTFPVPAAAQRDGASIFVVSLPKPRLGALVSGIKNLGLDVTSVDVTELAVRNLAWQCFPMADQNVGVLRLTANSGLITVSRGSDLYVARRISGVPEQFSAVALEEFRERLLLQVQRSIDYYESAMGQAGCDLLMVACTQSWTGPVTEFLRDALSIPVRAVSDAISDEFSVELYNPQRGKIDWGSVTDEEMNALCASLPALGGALRPIIEAEAA